MERVKKFSLKQISSVVPSILLLFTGILAICWIVTGYDFEPIITFILILIGFLGFFIDRWIRLRETRKSLLYALVHELSLNVQLLTDPSFYPNSEDAKKFTFFPRLSTPVIEATIISNVFTSKKDRKLFNLIFTWHTHSLHFNKRMDITEIAMLNRTPMEIKMLREKFKDGKVFSQIRNSLLEISKHLLEFYKKESGIDNNTILFEE